MKQKLRLVLQNAANYSRHCGYPLFYCEDAVVIVKVL